MLDSNYVALNVNWYIYLCYFALHATEGNKTAVNVIQFKSQNETRTFWLYVNTITEAPLAMRMNHSSAAKTVAQVFL